MSGTPLLDSLLGIEEAAEPTDKSNYSPIIQRESRRYGLDPSLLHAVVQQESAGNPRAVSRSGAMGLGQIMPATYKTLVDRGVVPGNDPFDPDENISASAYVLDENMRSFGGDARKALMAYNNGPDPSRWNNQETRQYPDAVLRRVSNSGTSVPESGTPLLDQILSGQLKLDAAPQVSPQVAQQEAPRANLSSLPGDVWSAVKSTPGAVKGAFASLLEGGNPVEIAGNKDWKDAAIEEARKTAQDQRSEDGASEGVVDFLGIKLNRGDIRTLPQSAAFSLISLGASIGGAIGGAVSGGPLAPVTGMAGGMAAGGASAYRMSANQFMRDLRDGMDQASIQQRGQPLTDQEFLAISQSEEIQNAALDIGLKWGGSGNAQELTKNYGLHEAAWEAVGNAITMGAGKFIIKGALQRGIIKPAIGMVGVAAGEVATEVPTQIGQQRQEAQAGLTGETPREWLNPDSWAKSFEEVAGPTLLQTALMGGGAYAGGRIASAIRGKEVLPQEQQQTNLDETADRFGLNEKAPVDEVRADPNAIFQMAFERPEAVAEIVDLVKDHQNLQGDPAVSQIVNAIIADPASAQDAAEQRPDILREIAALAAAPERQQLTANMSVAQNPADPNGIDGLKRLFEQASAGDEHAAEAMGSIAKEHLGLLLDGTSAKVETTMTYGLFGGQYEPSLAVNVSFAPEERDAVVGGMIRFGKDFNQMQVRVREATADKVGVKYSDNSYVTPAYRIELNRALSRDEVQDVISQSGLHGMTVSPKYLEAYYYGDTNDQAAVQEFVTNIRTAARLAGTAVRATRQGTTRLWVYGNKGNSGYGTLDSNIRPGQAYGPDTIARVADRAASEADINDLRVGLQREHGLAADDITLARPDSEQDAVAEMVAKSVGRRIVFVDSKQLEKAGVHGAAPRATPGTIFVRKNTSYPALAVTGHELLHQFSASHPKEYKQLTEALNQYIREFGAYLEKNPGLEMQVAHEELIADAMGDAMLQPQFWKRVFNANPGQAKSLMKRIMEFLDKLVAKVREAFRSKSARPHAFGTERFFSDIEQVRKVLADTFSQWQQEHAGTPAKGASVALKQERTGDHRRHSQYDRIPDYKLPERTGAHRRFDFDKEIPRDGQHQKLSRYEGHDVELNAEVLHSTLPLKQDRDLAIDMAQQMLYLDGVAHDKGFKDIDELLAKNADAFVAAAEKWRSDHQENPTPEELDQYEVEKIKSGEKPDNIRKTEFDIPSSRALGIMLKMSPKFMTWFEGSKVVDKDGNPKAVYHGTYGNFDTFGGGNVESDMGGGFYFTDSRIDASKNYASLQGADIQAKIETRAESIVNENDESYDDKEAMNRARRQAMKELGIQHKGFVMPTFLNLKNPAILGGKGETVLDYDVDVTYDDSGDIVTENETGSLVDFANTLRDIAHGYDEVDVDRALESIVDGRESITLREAIDKLRADENFYGSSDDEGNLVSNEIIRRTLEEMGYDGIIDHTVNKKFGLLRPFGKKMEGVTASTSHYIAFKPEQIKSIFNPEPTNSPNIMLARTHATKEQMAKGQMVNQEFQQAAEIQQPKKRDNAYARVATAIARRLDAATGHRIETLGRKLNNPMALVPDVDKLMSQRYIAMGLTQEADDLGAELYKTFVKATPADAKAIVEYWEDKQGNPATIVDLQKRQRAIDTKSLIIKIGQKLVERGVLDQETYEKFKGGYVPRVYLKYLLGNDVYGAISSGKKPDLSYAKHRMDEAHLPQHIREAVLGQIKDPGYLAALAIVRPLRDMAILDYMDLVSKNKDWAFQPSLVKYRGKKVSVQWLENEVKRLRDKKFQELLDPATAKKAEAEAAAMEAVAGPAKQKLQNSTYDLKDFKQVPDTTRFGLLRGMWIRQEIYDDLVGAGHINMQDAGWAERFFGYGGTGTKITSFWKAIKVSMNPPAVIRNAVSNGILLHLSGVSLHRMPLALIEAAKAMNDHNSPLWKIGHKYGVRGASFAASELHQIQDRLIVRHSGYGPMRLVHMAKAIVDIAGDNYQKLETLFKLAKIHDAMNHNKLDEVSAAMQAHKWLLDYSLVGKNTRYLRNAPIGIPFLTFQIKVAPLLAEVALKAPWRFAPYVMMANFLPMLLFAMLGEDYDDDEYKRMKDSLPGWIRDKGHVYILPVKDEHGRWEVLDLSYFMPWEMFSRTKQDLQAGDLGKAAKDVGLFSGPITDVIKSIATQKDGFTGNDIAKPGDPANLKMGAWLTYAWNIMAPPLLTNRGLIGPDLGSIEGPVGGRLPNAIEGVTDKMGMPRATVMQAIGSAFGVNAYPIDENLSRTKEIGNLSREIQDTVTAMKQALQDQSQTEERKQEIVGTYMREIERRQAKLADYMLLTEKRK